MTTVLLTGDINLMNTQPGDTPFKRIHETLDKADFVASNLECMLHVPEHGFTVEHEGFFLDPEHGVTVLKASGVDVFGIANNVNYGEAGIVGSTGALKAAGLRYSGAGGNRAEARAPVIVEKNGVRYGFLQRSCVYWSTNHEAGETGVGIAVIRGHTAYQVPMHREGAKTSPFNRPGIPPVVVTWADPEYLEIFKADVAALREQVDVVVASIHWGLGPQVLTYMKDIAKAAIDAGADVVMGHGPHHPLPLGFHKGKPIFYGLGCFSFHTGHLGVKYDAWVGLLGRLEIAKGQAPSVSFSFVRHDEANETFVAEVGGEQKTIDWLTKGSLPLGAVLTVEGERIVARST
jgi:poly-gamma-glutamate capsule biosynthesis protein CapA/YwtB (metallophosphatase superfamily)